MFPADASRCQSAQRRQSTSFSLHARFFPCPPDRTRRAVSSCARLFLGKAKAPVRLIGTFVGFSPFAICSVLSSSAVKFNESRDVAASTKSAQSEARVRPFSPKRCRSTSRRPYTAQISSKYRRNVHNDLYMQWAYRKRCVDRAFRTNTTTDRIGSKVLLKLFSCLHLLVIAFTVLRF